LAAMFCAAAVRAAVEMRIAAAMERIELRIVSLLISAGLDKERQHIRG
jgi:hypothetical protein